MSEVERKLERSNRWSRRAMYVQFAGAIVAMIFLAVGLRQGQQLNSLPMLALFITGTAAILTGLRNLYTILVNQSRGGG